MKKIFAMVQSAVGSQEVATTNGIAIAGMAAGKAASQVSDWLNVVILAGTALTIFVKLAWELRKMLHKRTAAKKRRFNKSLES